MSFIFEACLLDLLGGLAYLLQRSRVLCGRGALLFGRGLVYLLEGPRLLVGRYRSVWGRISFTLFFWGGIFAFGGCRLFVLKVSLTFGEVSFTIRVVSRAFCGGLVYCWGGFAYFWATSFVGLGCFAYFSAESRLVVGGSRLLFGRSRLRF